MKIITRTECDRYDETPPPIVLKRSILAVERWLGGEPISEIQQPEAVADWELPPVQETEVEFDSPKLERKKMIFADSKKPASQAPKDAFGKNFNEGFCYPEKSTKNGSSKGSSKKDIYVGDYSPSDNSNRQAKKELSSKKQFSKNSSNNASSAKQKIVEKEFAEEYLDTKLKYVSPSANEEGCIEYFLCDRAPLLPNLFYILPCDNSVLSDIEQFGSLPGQMSEYFLRRPPPPNWHTVAKY